MDVGIRELKAKLSAYLEQASSGTPIRITDRGKPRWVIMALDEEDPVDRGIREGWISAGPGFRSGKPAPKPVTARSRPGVRVQDILDEDRGPY